MTRRLSDARNYSQTLCNSSFWYHRRNAARSLSLIFLPRALLLLRSSLSSLFYLQVMPWRCYRLPPTCRNHVDAPVVRLVHLCDLDNVGDLSPQIPAFCLTFSLPSLVQILFSIFYIGETISSVMKMQDISKPQSNLTI